MFEHAQSFELGGEGLKKRRKKRLKRSKAKEEKLKWHASLLSAKTSHVAVW